MPNILDQILTVKRREVAALAPHRADLAAACRDAPPTRSLAAALRRLHKAADRRLPPDPIRVIAEVKHRSPSAGVLVEPFVPADIARRYAAAGADAISCLTDRDFFGGSIDHLRQVRAAVGLPVLRKDFIIDPVQVYEARAAGADAILLIAEALEPADMAALAALAADLNMDVLAEAHSASAVEKAIACGARLIGINNRDLTTFTVDLATTERLAPPILAAGRVLVSESGIRTPSDVRRLLSARPDAILVGETLLKSSTLAAILAEFRQSSLEP
jgi:indole-3-glycerol phosphate synthase